MMNIQSYIKASLALKAFSFFLIFTPLLTAQEDQKNKPLDEKEKKTFESITHKMRMIYEPNLDPNFVDDGHILQNEDVFLPNGMSYNCAINNVYGIHSACGPAYLIYGYHIDQKKDFIEANFEEKHLYNLYVIVEDKNHLPKIDIDVWDFTFPYYVIINSEGKEEYSKELDHLPHTYCIYYASGVEFIEHGDSVEHVFHVIDEKPIIITWEDALKFKKLHDEKQKLLLENPQENFLENVCDGPVNIYRIYDVAPAGQIEKLNLIDQCKFINEKDVITHTYLLDKRMHGFLFDHAHILSDQELLNFINKFFYVYSLNCFTGGEGMDVGGGGFGTGGSGGTGFGTGSSGGGSGGGGSSSSGTGTDSTRTTDTTGTAIDSGGRVTDLTTTTGDISVPEPSTYLLLGAGLMIILFMRYRRKKTAHKN